MRFEKSCGTIIYRYEQNRVLYLLVRYRLYSRYWGLIKGHVEAQESEVQTAMREVYEEVGFQDVRLIPGFRETISYCPFPDCVKDVVFFLGTTEEKDIRFIANEHDDFMWLSEQEARNHLKHGNDRFVVHRAELFLQNLLQ